MPMGNEELDALVFLKLVEGATMQLGAVLEDYLLVFLPSCFYPASLRLFFYSISLFLSFGLNYTCANIFTLLNIFIDC